tara:strand:+ start:355 stop:1374 length:1020 start_codon:yes stop_codon:yes gene_type:complete
MKILVSIASGSTNTERNILRAFYDGIEKYYYQHLNIDSLKVLKKRHGIDLRLSYDPEIEKCDVAIQFGTAKDRVAEHHITKLSIQKNAKLIIYIETPLLGRVINDKHDYSYYRIGVGGFLNNDGIFYHDEQIDQSRLQSQRSIINIPIFPGWKNYKDGNILILLQLPGDASLRGQKMSEWLVDTIEKLRSISERSIRIRLHPAMSIKGKIELLGEMGPIFFKNYNNIQWSDGHDCALTEELKSTGICISYTSGSCIDAILQGVPVIATDEGNLAYNISSHRLDDINNPKLVSDREVNQWMVGLANSQWSEQEILTGTVWKNIVSIIKEMDINEISSNIS